MKIFTLFLVFALVITQDLSFGQALAPNSIRLTNPSSFARADEPITVSREDISKMATSIPVGMVPFLKTAAGTIVPSQADDLNGDGSWDELAFLYSLQPNEKVQLQIGFATTDHLPKHTIRAHARLGKSPEKNKKFVAVKNEVLPKDHLPQAKPEPYQLEGPAWENDKVGFRIYFDSRNGKDIFGKTTNEMVLDKIGVDEDYHSLQAWGMDVLKVGNSLGAGSLALWENEKLNRLGAVGKASYELVADGPVRAIIRLHYNDWKVNNSTYQVEDEIVIWGGKYWYQSNVKISGFKGERTLVTGIVNLHSDKAIQQETDNGYSLLVTHAPQSENKDILGMGVLVSNDIFEGYGETPEDGEGVTQTYYTKLKAKDNKPVSFYFFAGWELSDKQFAQEKNFIEYIRQEASRLSDPIKISKGKRK